MAAAQRTGAALVTGANKGIGFAIAAQLARARPDLHVLLGSRDWERGEEAVAKLKADGVHNVRTLHVDLDDESSLHTAAVEVNSEFGGLDVLVNNAAVALKGNTFTESDARTTIDTNYHGTRHVCSRFMPLLRDNGRVVNVTARMASLSKLTVPTLKAAFAKPDLTLEELDALMEKFVADVTQGRYKEEGWPAGPGYPTAPYWVSKIGTNALTRVLARMEANNPNRSGVLVNACCPGFCRTDLAGPKAPRSPEQGADVAVYLSLLPAEATFNGLLFGERKELSF
ncbi:20beta-hydroxysteroid dehydrogenase [Acanthamoeba castellanii str. Neff]|uniref:20beta-hydroxysteroid dehydrogenase n=1 Tax=Acanthamoeba castellanii (strain ATCC 30010 / Neff) TaxID=1257118 RepID=L8HGK2_ACACF|nr:20beta-hydroxysteroid dehydrogenase [Acanthamoeba castellanii str. Neff]ELR24659.1 20beta-hydroxysteroid dehydrogenase [Acanthamoeba castellanii str. Neff]